MLNTWRATHSAILAPIAAAAPVVDRHRAEMDPSARWGVPAHVTVLYPFVPPNLIDPEIVRRAAHVAAGLPTVDVTLRRLDWFGVDVLYIAPEPKEWFRRATTLMHVAFPDFPPYGGVFEDVVPHLTVADRADIEAMKTAANEVGRSLPITERLDELVLMCGAQEPDTWRVIAKFPLRASR